MKQADYEKFLLRSSALGTSVVDQSLFSCVAEAMVKPPVVDTEQDVPIYASFADAYKGLRQNRADKSEFNRHPTIGARGERFRRHVAYAWAPIRRRVGKDWVQGEIALHVLHATKGWKIMHGITEALRTKAVMTGGA